jgi:hypothetical protein
VHVGEVIADADAWHCGSGHQYPEPDVDVVLSALFAEVVMGRWTAAERRVARCRLGRGGRPVR